MTLGSLFDGIGGFPLAGVMCGITPVWSSEIEPFPLKVTAARFPDMKQLGSVTDINGAEIEPVDIITFGSPCQDLSVAGKQLGIHEGQRSNLFFEAVRIIKEMRNADTANGRTGVDIRPRFAVWENVPGAFSSNKGADFQAVLQALASVSCDGVSIPRPKKWNHAGCMVGNGWSIAWRVYDAQYWGVPQRRKRIYLVADFASERAGEILFEREGVSGDSSESGTAGKGTAADAERGVGGSSLFEPRSLMDENWSAQDVKGALRAEASKSAHCVVEPYKACGVDGYNTESTGDVSITIRAGKSDQDHVGCVVYRAGGYGDMEDDQNYLARGNGDGSTSPTLTGDHENRVTDYTAVCVGNGQLHQMDLGDKSGALNCMHDQQAVITTAKPPRKYIVRRLTPTECARLQGFPDEWCEGLGGSDSAIYKAYGNGLALPCAYDVLRRIAKEYDKTTV